MEDGGHAEPADAWGEDVNPLGANAWTWVSPLTDERPADLAPQRIAVDGPAWLRGLLG